MQNCFPRFYPRQSLAEEIPCHTYRTKHILLLHIPSEYMENKRKKEGKEIHGNDKREDMLPSLMLSV